MVGASMIKVGPLLVVLGAALALGACATDAPPPRAELAAAEVALRGAETADAARFAPAPLTLAQDKYARAGAAMEARRFVDARRLAEQALADAQLAEAEARSQVARHSAAELQESIRLLREEIERQRPATS
jgi:hypothetical protein